MPQFHIVPTDQSFSTAEIIATDASQVLGIVQRLECKSAEIWRDGAYSYSVRLEENGIWAIFQRPEPDVNDRDKVVSLHQ